MQRIKRMKQKIICKMFLTILLTVGAVLYLKSIDLKYYESYAQNSLESSPIVLEVEASNGYVLNVDNDIKNKDNIINLKVSNDTYMNNYYEIALKVSNNCDYKKLNVLVENEYYNLKDILIYQDNEYNYFLIAKNELIASQDNYEVSLFANENDINYFNENEVFMDFVDLSLENV